MPRAVFRTVPLQPLLVNYQNAYLIKFKAWRGRSLQQSRVLHLECSTGNGGSVLKGILTERRSKCLIFSPLACPALPK
jgi:hypothetical protein